VRRALTLSLLLLSVAAPVAAQVQRPLPAIQRIDPTFGPPGTELTLFGRYFAEGQEFLLGDAALPVLRLTPTRVVVRVPEGARTGRIRARAPRGEVPTRLRFRVTAARSAPVITGFSPATGEAGTEVTLRGEHFSPRLPENEVFLGERPLTVLRATASQLAVRVPSGAVTGAFRVRVVGAGEAESAEPFVVGEGFAITGFSPAVGTSGSEITITGVGFDTAAPRNRAFLGRTRLTVRRASPTELVVRLPRRGAETGLLRVLRGSREATSARPFRVASRPRIAGLSPRAGGPGTCVTLVGSGFGSEPGDVEARIQETVLPMCPTGGVPVRDDELRLAIPEGAPSGPIAVTVAGLGPAESPAFTALEALRLTGMSPTRGNPGSEALLEMRGVHEAAGTYEVTLSGAPAEVLEVSGAGLRVRIPDGRSGPFEVRLGGETVRARQPFVVTHAPEITAVAPRRPRAGEPITVTGRYFTDAMTVRLGDRELDGVTRSDSTSFTVTLPEDAESGPLTASIRVEGSGGGVDLTVRRARRRR
jgi:hypothetical protein